MVKTYNCTCNRKIIFGDAATFINKDCRVLFGDIFIVPFLCPALGWTAMWSLWWGNLVAIDSNDLPVGREFDSLRGRHLKGKGKGVLGVTEMRGVHEEGGRQMPTRKPLFSPSCLLIMYAK